MTRRIRPINWNAIIDEKDLQMWEKFNENLWIDTKIPLSNDIKSWSTLSPEQQLATRKVFTGLTALDTIQGFVGAPALMVDAVTPHEEAVLSQIGYMECVHAKSYSSIFSTLNTSEEIEDNFRWADTSDTLRKKQELIMEAYEGDDPHKKKILSTLLESFLFYSGFYLPLYWSSRGILNNTADIIRLIVRDEGLHGYYIGYKYQKSVEKLDKTSQEYYRDFTIETLLDLMDNEEKYTQEIYDPIGLTEDVKKFLKFNANKALMNLGYDVLYPANLTDTSSAVMSALSLNSGETSDFFSSAGSNYIMPKVEEMSDDDWEL